MFHRHDILLTFVTYTEVLALSFDNINILAIFGNYSAIALHLNPRLKYTAKRPIKRQNKVSIFLAYVRYFLYLYTYERASYGHIKSTARHDSRDKVDA